MENSIVVFGQNLMKHATVLLLLVPALLCLCLFSLSGTSNQAQAHKQAQTHNRKGSSLQLNVLLRLHCLLCTLRLFFLENCPNQLSKNKIWEAKTDKMWLLTLDWTVFFSFLRSGFASSWKKPHLFFGQNLVKTATVHTLLQQPLHSRVAPLLCLPPLASSQLGGDK